MKTFTLILFLLFLSACGEEGQAPELVHSCSTLEAIGEWQNTERSSDRLIVSSNCTATASYCETDMSFTLPDEQTGETTVTIHEANLNAGCMQPQETTCQVGILQNGYLLLDCGTTNQFTYRRPNQ